MRVLQQARLLSGAKTLAYNHALSVVTVQTDRTERAFYEETVNAGVTREQ